MTGSQFQKSSRATSYSPRLKYYPNKTTTQGSSCQGPSQRQFSEKPKATPNKGSVTPVRPGKRRHQAIVSPITTRTESASPKAKFRSTISSPVALSDLAPTGSSAFTSSSSKDELFLQSNDNLNGLGNSLAVPKVSAEPPCPSQLPSPPKHWVAEKNAQCLAKKQQCRVVTQCLMSHLASSGILVSA